MGHPIHTNSSILKSIHVSRIQNTEQNRDETQRRQFALTLQQEAARKESRVQDSHKSEAPEIDKKHENKEKRKKQKKRSSKESIDEQQEQKEEEHHIDLMID